MADKAPKTTGAKEKPKYEMAENETGAFVRVLVDSTGKPQAPATFRPAITTAAVAASKKPANENELVFNESGEELTGEAKAKAQAEAAAKLKEEELVFNESGEELTGEARAKAQAEANRLPVPVPVPVTTTTTAQPKLRKIPQNVATFAEVSDKEKVKIFYRYRQKEPKFFVYTPEGNLEIKAGNAVNLPATIIPMRAFSELTPEELEEIEQTRMDMEKADNEKYVILLKQLREAQEAYNPQDSESIKKIVLLNQQLHEANVSKVALVYPEIWVRIMENPSVNEIDLNNPHEERKTGYDVHIFKRYFLSRNDAEGHYRQHGTIQGQGQGQGMQGGATVVLFLTNVDDQQTGQFHPAFEREFVYNETKYASPYQAFETERFKELEDEGMVKQLLGTRSAKTIRSLASQEKQQPQFPVKLWEEILEAFYTQFKDAADKLKATGSARFHMMDKNTASPDYAIALANVRTKLKEQESDAPANVDPIKQSVISEEEQKKAKVGAIINNFRRFG